MLNEANELLGYAAMENLPIIDKEYASRRKSKIPEEENVEESIRARCARDTEGDSLRGEMSLSALWELCRDLYLIVRFQQLEQTGPAKGGEFENAIISYVRGSQPFPQRAEGTDFVLGRETLSGFNHETDAVIESDTWTALAELKALTNGEPKNEIMIFNQKSLDFFLAVPKKTTILKPTYRLLVSANDVPEDVQKFCYNWRIIVIEPSKLPIPVLLSSSSLLHICRRVRRTSHLGI